MIKDIAKFKDRTNNTAHACTLVNNLLDSPNVEVTRGVLLGLRATLESTLQEVDRVLLADEVEKRLHNGNS